MEDRLAELQQLSGPIVAAPEQDEDKRVNEFMPVFVNTTQIINKFLDIVTQNNEEIAILKGGHRAATQAEKEKEIAAVIQRLIEENNLRNAKVKDLLKELADDIEQSNKTEKDEPETRMKITTHATLSNKFQEVLKQSQTIQMEFKASVKNKIARQAKLINDKLTDEQVKELCDDPEAAQKMMSSVMFGASHTKMQNAVSDMQDKYRDIQKLEASVNLVFEMFKDLALLVHAQGEMLDNIEENINCTANYVNKAATNMGKAKENFEAAQRVKSSLSPRLSFNRKSAAWSCVFSSFLSSSSVSH